MAETYANQKPSFARQQTPQNNDRPFDKIQKNINGKTHFPPGKGLMKTQAEAADYITEMLVVLCNMAKDVDLRFLNYLLEMAYEESLSHSGETSKFIKNHTR